MGHSCPFHLHWWWVSSGDDGMLQARRKIELKSGKIWTMDSTVNKKVVWPHKVVFTTQGQPPVYSDMSIALFMNGYLTVLAEKAKDNKPFLLQHLQELMEEAKIYSWRAVRDYHSVRWGSPHYPPPPPIQRLGNRIWKWIWILINPSPVHGHLFTPAMGSWNLSHVFSHLRPTSSEPSMCSGSANLGNSTNSLPQPPQVGSSNS